MITLNCSSKRYSMDILIDLIVVLSLELGSLIRREGRGFTFICKCGKVECRF